MARFYIERRQEDDAVRRIVQLLGDAGGAGQPDCTPPVDVIEHSDRVEIIVDVPGVPASELRVIYARGTLVVAGRKLPRVCTDSVAFHLAERSFGRFVRAVTLSGAVDAGHTSATLTGGELRVLLPRIEERRGRDINIEVTGG